MFLRFIIISADLSLVGEYLTPIYTYEIYGCYVVNLIFYVAITKNSTYFNFK